MSSSIQQHNIIMTFDLSLQTTRPWLGQSRVQKWWLVVAYYYCCCCCCLLTFPAIPVADAFILTTEAYYTTNAVLPFELARTTCLSTSHARFCCGTTNVRTLVGTRTQRPTKGQQLWARNKAKQDVTGSSSTTENKPKAAKLRTWDESYALLVEHFEENGHADVVRFYKNDTKLGAWVEAQRRRRASLPKDKVAKLDALNLTWDGVYEKKKIRGGKKCSSVY